MPEMCIRDRYTPEEKEIVIELDPGMAFGTGSHDTTRLCLEMLETYIKPRMKVIDFGTGSGILAIAAAKMRASLVIAFDMDEIAVKAARENVILNDQEAVSYTHLNNRMSLPLVQERNIIYISKLTSTRYNELHTPIRINKCLFINEIFIFCR